MIAILSPAKNLDFDTPVSSELRSEPEFAQDTEKLIKKLKKLKPKAIADLMKLSPKLADLNYERYQSFDFDHQNNTKQASFAFNGEVYSGLAMDTFSEKELEFAQDHVRILSGLYGLLKPMDMIQPYRLEMGTRFKTSATKKNLYEFWDGKVTKALNQALEETNSQVLVNLASNEYYKVVQSKSLKKPVLIINFKERKGNDYKMVMVYAKKARGFMANYIIKHHINSVNDLKGFDTEGYAFNDSLSSEEEWIFTR